MVQEPAFRKKALVGEFYYVGMMKGGIPVLHPMDACWEDGVYDIVENSPVTLSLPRLVQRDLKLACGPFAHGYFRFLDGAVHVEFSQHLVPLAALAGKSVQLCAGWNPIHEARGLRPMPVAVRKTAAA